MDNTLISKRHGFYAVNRTWNFSVTLLSMECTILLVRVCQLFLNRLCVCCKYREMGLGWEGWWWWWWGVTRLAGLSNFQSLICCERKPGCVVHLSVHCPRAPLSESIAAPCSGLFLWEQAESRYRRPDTVKDKGGWMCISGICDSLISTAAFTVYCVFDAFIYLFI